ncbi:hypothetical protein WUBG_06428 [Wuchereria bancrofti]|uniref:Uncharacterized protein n=1 Tax=Wuchereria bancrofti TaxID=6293 RepID=J9EZM4_WUCBA|nr:hypothetical protein WUBG_06428 [Wuchereria bancrofti]VDM07916.1 unnamed protein product [Wuchereria bancrofti]
MSEVNSATTFTTTILTSTIETSDGDWNDSKTGTIVVIFLVVLISLIIAGYIGYRKLKERRRSHGEYRPQFEEYQHAKNLPYLQPPSIEGLI